MNILIVAGGQGTRLWPVSRKSAPKQLLKFIDDHTLLEQTFARLRKGFSPTKIFVATGKNYAEGVKEQLPNVPNKNYVLEPVARDRGTAVLLGLMLIDHVDIGGQVALCWSDHYIKKEANYIKTLKLAGKILDKDPNQVIGIGVKPLYPHTGFDYLEKGKALNMKGAKAYDLKRVKIRGDLRTTTNYVNSGVCFWNTGYWVTTTSYLLSEFKRMSPEAFELASKKIRPYLGTNKQQRVLDSHFPSLPTIELEKSIMLNASKKTLLVGDFDWIDVGSWKVVKDSLSEKRENLTKGLVSEIDTTGSLIYNYEDKLVATVGVENLIIVNTKDALLVSTKSESEEKIRDLIKKLKSDAKLKKYL